VQRWDGAERWPSADRRGAQRRTTASVTPGCSGDTRREDADDVGLGLEERASVALAPELAGALVHPRAGLLAGSKRFALEPVGLERIEVNAEDERGILELTGISSKSFPHSVGMGRCEGRIVWARARQERVREG
jgi:hypothetical protein